MKALNGDTEIQQEIEDLGTNESLPPENSQDLQDAIQMIQGMQLKFFNTYEVDISSLKQKIDQQKKD